MLLPAACSLTSLDSRDGHWRNPLWFSWPPDCDVQPEESLPNNIGKKISPERCISSSMSKPGFTYWLLWGSRVSSFNSASNVSAHYAGRRYCITLEINQKRHIFLLWRKDKRDGHMAFHPFVFITWDIKSHLVFYLTDFLGTQDS